MKPARLAAILVLTGLLAGCGYQLPGRTGTKLPAEVRTIHVQMFENRTYRPFLEFDLANFVIGRLARSRLLRLVDHREAADAVLNGSIVLYETVPISYDRQDQIREYRSRMSVEAVLRHAADGRVLWKGVVSWAEEYPSSMDKNVQEINELAAIRVISQRLAEEIYTRMVDDF